MGRPARVRSMSRFLLGLDADQSFDRRRQNTHQHHFGSPPSPKRAETSAKRSAVNGTTRSSGVFGTVRHYRAPRSGGVNISGLVAAGSLRYAPPDLLSNDVRTAELEENA